MRKKKHYVAKAGEFVHDGPNIPAEVLRSEDGTYHTYLTVDTRAMPSWVSTRRAKEVATALNALEAKRSKDRRAAARRRKAAK